MNDKPHPTDDATRARQLLFAATTHAESRNWRRARWYSERAARLYRRLAEDAYDARDKEPGVAS